MKRWNVIVDWDGETQGHIDTTVMANDMEEARRMVQEAHPTIDKASVIQWEVNEK